MLSCLFVVKLPLVRQHALVSRIIGALLPLFLAACSTLQFGYQQADSLSYWWLDSYLDLESAQSPQVRADLTALHAWHRRHELPLYIELLQQMQRLASDSQTKPQQICALIPELRQRMLRLGGQTAAMAASLVVTLTPAQLHHLAQQFDKRNRRWREQWLDLSTAEFHEHRFKQAKERAELLYGRLNKVQLALLHQQLAGSSFDPRLSYREALRRQQDILNTLREHSATSARATHVADEMLALIERSVLSPDPVYRRHSEQWIAESCQLLAALHGSASALQRAHAKEQLQSYAEDLRALLATQP
jgi:hypothetical protein